MRSCARWVSPSKPSAGQWPLSSLSRRASARVGPELLAAQRVLRAGREQERSGLVGVLILSRERRADGRDGVDDHPRGLLREHLEVAVRPVRAVRRAHHEDWLALGLRALDGEAHVVRGLGGAERGELVAIRGLGGGEARGPLLGGDEDAVLAALLLLVGAAEPRGATGAAVIGDVEVDVGHRHGELLGDLLEGVPGAAGPPLQEPERARALAGAVALDEEGDLLARRIGATERHREGHALGGRAVALAVQGARLPRDGRRRLGVEASVLGGARVGQRSGRRGAAAADEQRGEHGGEGSEDRAHRSGVPRPRPEQA